MCATSPIGLGLMRLSLLGADRDAQLTIDAAIDAGIRFFDTADVYAPTANDIGHNERLLAASLRDRPGASATIATKGGLTRPMGDGRWLPDGRARHLAAACEASLERLGRIDLYQLHVVDPRTPLATSVRALAALRRSGMVGGIGLCNVTATQLEEALRLTLDEGIEAIQVAVGPFDERALRSGVVAAALARGVRVLAHTPLGGTRGAARLAREPTLLSVAERHGATAAEVFLAWLAANGVQPLAGATRPETARSAAAAGELARRLDDGDRAALAERFPWLAPRRPAVASAGSAEIILMMGTPGAGKSTATAPLVAEGWARLNRDEAGGSLDGLAAELERLLAGGARRVVLDNTYATRRSRAAVIDAASRHGASVRCVWLETSIDDAQVNVCLRLVDQERREGATGGIAGPPGPDALFRFRRELEPPSPDEGFASIETRHFARAAVGGARRGVIVDCDAALWRSRSGARSPSDPDDLEVVPGARELVEGWRTEGRTVTGISWQPEIAAGARTLEGFAALVARLAEELGGAIDVRVCPHAGGPPACWCRPPLPGLGVVLARAHDLDLGASIFVGRGPSGRAFAAKLGLEFRPAL